jgi:hypothetical protein
MIHPAYYSFRVCRFLLVVVAGRWTGIGYPYNIIIWYHFVGTFHRAASLKGGSIVFSIHGSVQSVDLRLSLMILCSEVYSFILSRYDTT